MDLSMTSCDLCPRHCKADRTAGQGFCGAPATPKLARAALHLWEEPCISGTRGSGTVFFSHCNLRCCYCQNWSISADGFGREISVQRLAQIFLELQEKGAHNLNLVTAAPYLPFVLQALDAVRPQLKIPVVYNTGGYESAEALQALNGYVDIYLTDMKYFSPELSARYSAAPDYFSFASAATKIMLSQVGHPVFDTDGLLQRGVIIRHLVLPGAIADSKHLLDWLKANFSAQDILVSLMSQYTPFYKAVQLSPLNRRISSYEYNTVVDYCLALGFDKGFMQERSSAKEEYTPAFDLEGV